MSESIKATRATVAIGALTVDAFMLPDGSYRMSQAGAAETVGKDEINARRFLTSKSINAIRGEGYTPDSIEVESLSESFDNAFGVIRSEQERNETTTAKIKTLETALTNLSEGFAIDDDIRRERDYYASLLKQNGIEPYELPNRDRQ